MRGSRLALGMTAIALGLSIAAMLLVHVNDGGVANSEATGSAVLAISFALVGGVIAVKTGNVIGWLMLVSGFFGSFNAVSGDYSQIALENGWPLRAMSAWIGIWVWTGSAVAYPLVLLLFPTGRPPSRRWSPVAIAAVAGAAAAATASAIEAWPLAWDRVLTAEQVFHRLGNSRLAMLGALGLAALGLSLLAAGASLFVRYRRAATLERQQLKWLVVGAAFFIFVLFTVSPAAPVDLAERIPLLSLIALLGLPAIPVAIGVAVLRYRLYDIDVVINRTLVYGLLTGILAASYLGLVALMQLVLQPLTPQSDLSIVASTLAVAALFQPLRARLQTFIDRRFYRRKYDAADTLDAFSARLRDQVDLESLRAEIVTVVGTTMQPAHASLWLKAGKT